MFCQKSTDATEKEDGSDVSLLVLTSETGGPKNRNFASSEGHGVVKSLDVYAQDWSDFTLPVKLRTERMCIVYMMN